MFKDTALNEDTVLTLKTLDADIGTEPHHLPFIAAAGVLFLEANHVAQPYLDNHFYDVMADKCWLISFCSVKAARRAASGKSFPREAYMICRDEFRITPFPWASTP